MEVKKMESKLRYSNCYFSLITGDRFLAQLLSKDVTKVFHAAVLPARLTERSAAPSRVERYAVRRDVLLLPLHL